MGEKKRRERAGSAAIERIVQELAEEGKLIEAGFAALAKMAIPPDAPPVQRREMKLAYMAGAQHLFSSILGILDPGTEATPAELRRLELINGELEAWRATMAAAAADAERGARAGRGARAAAARRRADRGDIPRQNERAGARARLAIQRRGRCVTQDLAATAKPASSSSSFRLATRLTAAQISSRTAPTGATSSPSFAR